MDDKSLLHLKQRFACLLARQIHGEGGKPAKFICRKKAQEAQNLSHELHELSRIHQPTDDNSLAAKKRDASADTSALERDIDQQIYALYGLTPEEIKIVEDSAK